MRVLIACEFSGIVRDAFRVRGHDAWSCDLLPCERGPAYHIQTDIRRALHLGQGIWDLIIAHPPCTYLANSGARWLYKDGKKDIQRWDAMIAATHLFYTLLSYDCPKIAVENPIMHGHARRLIGRKQDQIIQPWQYGHKEMKATCFWFKDLPLLKPTNIVGPPPKNPEERKTWAVVHRMPPGPNRTKDRSRTLQGIADAMAEQWGT